MVGAIIRPKTTSQFPIKHNVPFRLYSNSIRSGCPGRMGIEGAIRSKAWMPHISSTEMVRIFSDKKRSEANWYV
jgi:hypothetical protein